MKLPPALQILAVWLLVVILGAALTMTRASASDADAELDDPVVVGKAATSDDPVMTTLSTSQCGSGYLCVWSESNYQGTIQRFSTQSKYTSISIRVRSFYNNRSKRVYIYGDPGGSPSACYGAGTKRATTTSWVPSAEGTYLSTATSC